MATSEGGARAKRGHPLPRADPPPEFPLLNIPHDEKHFRSTDTVRDIVIGMSDGLTVPFALAAGLSGAIDNTTIVVTAGLAEIVAGAIAMGLGGYLAARTDYDHYHTERRRELRETELVPEKEREEVAEIFREYGLSDQEIAPMLTALEKDKQRWVDFMMRFELGLEPPDRRRAPRSATTIAFSYLVGGLIPLAPYMLIHQIQTALWCSVGVTLLALLVFGYIKARFTGIPRFKGALQTAAIGSIAAAAAFGIAKLVAG